jgi:hypothetical protein
MPTTRFTSRGGQCRTMDSGVPVDTRIVSKHGLEHKCHAECAEDGIRSWVCMQRPATQLCGLTFFCRKGLFFLCSCFGADLFARILPDDNVGRLHRTLQLD